MMLWGENDLITPVAMARAFQQGIGESRLEVIPACGHLPCLEKPKEFVEAVLAFVD
jgi:pimeloyl-ACP methyl ester carboxylesterase